MRCAHSVRNCLAVLLIGCAPVFGDFDPKPHVSPDGRHAIHNIGDTANPDHCFEIRTKDGKVLLAALGEPWVPTHANKILWSADSDFVLISFDEGKLKSTCVYSFREQKLVSLSHVGDGWTVPIRWVSPRTFIVEDSGPHGGKARGGGYHCRKTYRIRMQPFRLDCVYKSPTITTKDDPDAC